MRTSGESYFLVSTFEGNIEPREERVNIYQYQDHQCAVKDINIKMTDSHFA